MGNKGKGSGLALIVVLVVAVIVAYLAITQMGSLGFLKKEPQRDPAAQAQVTVDAINERMQQAISDP